jgi:hypothetical protein
MFSATAASAMSARPCRKSGPTSWQPYGAALRNAVLAFA